MDALGALPRNFFRPHAIDHYLRPRPAPPMILNMLEANDAAFGGCFDPCDFKVRNVMRPTSLALISLNCVELKRV